MLVLLKYEITCICQLWTCFVLFFKIPKKKKVQNFLQMDMFVFFFFKCQVYYNFNKKTSKIQPELWEKQCMLVMGLEKENLNEDIYYDFVSLPSLHKMFKAQDQGKIKESIVYKTKNAVNVTFFTHIFEKFPLHTSISHSQ